MIPLEQQVTSLVLSKRLKELGEKQDSLYSYFQYDEWNILLRETREIFTPNNECGYNKENLICSAPTVAELGEVLPGEIYMGSLKQTAYYLDCGKIDSESSTYVRYINHDLHDTLHIEHGKSEANARAKMRIYLIENKLVEVK